MKTVDFPPRTEHASVVSPAFDLARPRVVNASLIPVETRRVLEQRWNAARFAEKKVEVHLLQDVFVVADGLVFNRALDVYRATVTQQKSPTVAAARQALDFAIKAGRLKREAGRYALCKKAGSGNYGHWLIEMLPMAHIVRTCCASPNLRYLVPQAGGRLQSVIETSMEIIGIPRSEQVPLAGAPAWLEELLVVTGLTQHGRYISPRVFDPLDRIVQSVAPGPRRRLLVTRKSAGCRNFADESGVTRTFTEAGYETIDPGVMDFAAQVASFKGAEAIAGVTGAALTNIVFSRPGTRVTNFAPASQFGTFFWLLAGQRNLDYLEVRCAQTGTRCGPAPWDTDLLVSQADLAAVIEAPRA